MIQKKSALIIKDLWNGTHFKAEMKKGKTDGFDIWVDSMFSQSFFSKNNAIQMYQWRPEKYYAKIDIDLKTKSESNETFVYNYYIMDEMAKKELISWIVNLK